VSSDLQSDVLIVGGGPAGALLSFLLVRQGLSVVLAEKELDLERTFRGETIAARSVRTLMALGFGPALERHGYLKLTGISLWEQQRRIIYVDYRRFPIAALPIDIPQPALIGAFLDAAREFPSFQVLSGAKFTELVEEPAPNNQKRVTGGRLTQRDGSSLTVHARLVVGADGRFSRVRKVSGLEAAIEPMERDFLWFKLPRPADWGLDGQLVVDRDKHLVILPTFPDYLRVGYNLPKRGFTDMRKQGFDTFKTSIVALDPRLTPLVDSLQSWSDTSFLEIFTAELQAWARDGLILIGDASHTATPILGQGVNLAIQDAVFLAPVVIAFLRQHAGVVTREALAGFVNKRRKHKRMVTRFQRIQERSLALSRPLSTLMRRTRLRALDLFPLKYRLLDRVLNSPHELDPEVTHVAAE